MSLAWFVLLILGAIATAVGFVKKQQEQAVFWFLLAFWAYIVLSAIAGCIPLTL
jgi:uncharacterized protein (DUF983 family)